MPYFVLTPTFRNFGFTEVTCTQQSKEKFAFFFALHSFFRNSAIRNREVTPSCIKKMNEFILFYPRLSVTLSPHKVLT